MPGCSTCRPTAQAQPHRRCLRQAQGPPAQGRRTQRRGVVGRHRCPRSPPSARRNVPTTSPQPATTAMQSDRKLLSPATRTNWTANDLASSVGVWRPTTAATAHTATPSRSMTRDGDQWRLRALQCDAAGTCVALQRVTICVTHGASNALRRHWQSSRASVAGQTLQGGALAAMIPADLDLSIPICWVSFSIDFRAGRVMHPRGSSGGP